MGSSSLSIWWVCLLSSVLWALARLDTPFRFAALIPVQSGLQLLLLPTASEFSKQLWLQPLTLASSDCISIIIIIKKSQLKAAFPRPTWSIGCRYSVIGCFLLARVSVTVRLKPNTQRPHSVFSEILLVSFVGICKSVNVSIPHSWREWNPAILIVQFVSWCFGLAKSSKNVLLLPLLVTESGRSLTSELRGVLRSHQNISDRSWLKVDLDD